MDLETVVVARSEASERGIPLAHLLAVIQVESGGVIFAVINGRKEPLIRFEGHYFYKRLAGEKQAEGVAEKLASPKPGGVPNPATQEARWELLWRAARIDREAAYESVSWGVGQVMGSHWRVLGYPSVQALVDRARGGVAGQLELMLRYIEHFSLMDELKRGDWAAFARGYNGPATKGYDTQLKKYVEEFHAKYGGGAPIPVDPDAPPPSDLETYLRMGTSGARVRIAQALLERAGITCPVDGDFGPATKAAVEKFQTAHGIAVDGLIGPETWRALDAFRVDPGEEPGVPGPVEAAVKTAKGRQGAATVILGGAIQAMKEALKPVLGTPWIDNIYAYLSVAAVVVMLAGALWAWYGWHRANTTHGVAK